MKRVIAAIIIMAITAGLSFAASPRPDSKKGMYWVSTIAELQSLDQTAASTPNQYDLADGDSAILMTLGDEVGAFSLYVYDISSNAAESSPYVIRPTDFDTAGVWVRTDFANAGPVYNTKAAAYTIGTDNPVEAVNGIIFVTGAAIVTGPPAVEGVKFAIIVTAAAEVELNPDNSGTEDTIDLDGVAGAIGKNAISTSAAGDVIWCTYSEADHLYCYSSTVLGTNWTKEP